MHDVKKTAIAAPNISLAEFRLRRQRLAKIIDDGAVALLQGSNGPTGADAFRQYNDMYYLTGIEVPGMYALIQGGCGSVTVFLPQESQLDRQQAGQLICADNVDFVRTQTGVDAVKGLHALGEHIERATVVYTNSEEGQVRGVNRHNSESWVKQLKSEPWDTRLDQAGQLTETLNNTFPHLDVRNLSDIMDELRLIKSDAEVAIMRHAGRLCAHAVNDAMRATHPGAVEYQLDAVMRYHYLVNGAVDKAYHTIIASEGNMLYPHYHLNNRVLDDGDWLLCDGAPEIHYYTSDIGRMWPVNGTYSPAQRAVYGYVVEYHKAFLAAIRPGRLFEEIRLEVAETMRPIFNEWTFETPEQRAGAAAMFDFKHHLSHAVGMSCHDGFGHYNRPLEEGMVFSVDPTLEHKELRMYVRVEDTVLVTEDGIENLTAAAPLELDDVEALMKEAGMLLAFPASP
jgi:Xaa-Pro aminopeptidase